MVSFGSTSICRGEGRAITLEVEGSESGCGAQVEFEAGQDQLANLEARQASLKETMLRISGAIQVSQEVLAASSEQSGSKPPELEITSEQEVEEHR